MLIIGTKAYVDTLRRLTMVCWNCRQAAAQRLEQQTNKLTIFFIPLFPVTRTYSLSCTMCGVTQKLDRGVARQILHDGRVAGL